MSNIHISNGRLLLQNITDELWYFVDVEIVDELPYLRISQSNIVVQSDYNPYVVIKDSDGYYDKLFLDTNDGEVHYGVERLIVGEPAIRLYLKGDGVYYEILMTINDGNPYVQIVDSSGNVLTTIPLPWRQITPAGFKTETTVIVLV